MGSFNNFKLTQKGIDAEYKAQSGKVLEFTRFGLGDGEVGTTPIKELTALKHEVLSRAILKLDNRNSKIIIGFTLDNKDIAEGFYWREIGIFAKDPDTQEEVLFMYANAGDTADYIPAGSSGTMLEKYIDVNILVSDIENIAPIIDSSLVYATKKDFETFKLEISGYVPVPNNVTLESTNWFLSNTTGYYEYTIENSKITKKHLAIGNMDIANQKKLKDGYIETYNGGLKIITSKKPTEDIQMNVVIWETAESVSPSGGTGTYDYNDLENKPSINGVELVGDLTSDDLNIDTSGIDESDVATDEEVQDEVDKWFNTTNSAEDEPNENNVATDEEVQEEIDRNF